MRTDFLVAIQKFAAWILSAPRGNLAASGPGVMQKYEGKSVMDNIDQLAMEFVLSLDHTTKLETAFDSLSTVVTAMGFDSITYTLFPLTLTTDFPPIFLCSRDFSRGFLKHYLSLIHI